MALDLNAFENVSCSMERTILSLAGTSCSNTDLLVENPSSLAVVVVFWYYTILRFVLETSVKWPFNF